MSNLPKGFKNYYTNDQDFNVMFEALTIAVAALEKAQDDLHEEFCSAVDHAVCLNAKEALRRIAELGGIK